jgi:hypothetical protein
MFIFPPSQPLPPNTIVTGQTYHLNPVVPGLWHCWYTSMKSWQLLLSSVEPWNVLYGSYWEFLRAPLETRDRKVRKGRNPRVLNPMTHSVIFIVCTGLLHKFLLASGLKWFSRVWKTLVERGARWLDMDTRTCHYCGRKVFSLFSITASAVPTSQSACDAKTPLLQCMTSKLRRGAHASSPLGRKSRLLDLNPNGHPTHHPEVDTSLRLPLLKSGSTLTHQPSHQFWPRNGTFLLGVPCHRTGVWACRPEFQLCRPRFFLHRPRIRLFLPRIVPGLT